LTLLLKGTEQTDSDIDLFILVKNQQSKEGIEKPLEELTTICLDRYGNRLASYLLTKTEFKQKENLEIISEINKGEQIYP